MALTLQEDMGNIFLQSGFEEIVSYTPAGGVAKDISAIIYREGTVQTVPSRRTGQSENKTITRRYDIEIEIANDATNGIEDVTVHEDSVALKRNPNDAANEDFLVRGVIYQDVGVWRLGVG